MRPLFLIRALVGECRSGSNLEGRKAREDIIVLQGVPLKRPHRNANPNMNSELRLRKVLSNIEAAQEI